MANITTQNPIRYQIDNLSYAVSGVIASNDSTTVNLAGASRVSGITIHGSQPSGTQRYFAFRIGNQWGALTSAGNFQAFTSNSADYANISTYGNSANDLAQLTDIPALAGKTFGIAIALYAEDPDNAIPTARLTFNCITESQRLTTTEYSPVYDLGSSSQMISLNADTETSSGGSVDVLAQATLEDGTVTGWKTLDSFAGTKAKTIQLRGDYKASVVGQSIAQISNAYVIYANGSSLASGLTDGEIITQTQDWYMPLHHCRLTVNHAPLENSTLKAYVAFREQPIDIRGETLGIGSGGRKTFQLLHTGGIKYDSFKLYYDNVQVYDTFELNCEVGRVTCEAPEGVIVSCDYSYGWDYEEWHKMTLSSRLSMDGYDQSEFRFSQPENSKSMAAIKITLGMTSGHINNEVIGTGAGTARSYRLTHRILDGKISLTANNAGINSKNWILLDDPQYVSVAAASGSTIRASYDWISEPPIIYQFAAVFAE